jgi:hypothetical protein
MPHHLRVLPDPLYERDQAYASAPSTSLRINRLRRSLCFRSMNITSTTTKPALANGSSSVGSDQSTEGPCTTTRTGPSGSVPDRPPLRAGGVWCRWLRTSSMVCCTFSMTPPWPIPRRSASLCLRFSVCWGSSLASAVNGHVTTQPIPPKNEKATTTTRITAGILGRPGRWSTLTTGSNTKVRRMATATGISTTWVQ